MRTICTLTSTPSVVFLSTGCGFLSVYAPTPRSSRRARCCVTPWHETAVRFVAAQWSVRAPRALILSGRRRVDVAPFGRAPGASVHVRVVAIHVRELPVRAVAVQVYELPVRVVAVDVHEQPVRDVWWCAARGPVVCCPEVVRPVAQDVRET